MQYSTQHNWKIRINLSSQWNQQHFLKSTWKYCCGWSWSTTCNWWTAAKICSVTFQILICAFQKIETVPLLSVCFSDIPSNENYGMLEYFCNSFSKSLKCSGVWFSFSSSLKSNIPSVFNIGLFLSGDSALKTID